MNIYGCGEYMMAQFTIQLKAIIKWAVRVLPTSYHFLSTPLLGLRAAPADFAGYSVIVPMSLIPPTSLRTAFLQFMLFLLPTA